MGNNTTRAANTSTAVRVTWQPNLTQKTKETKPKKKKHPTRRGSLPSSWSCTKNCAPVRPMLSAAREGATADSPCAHVRLCSPTLQGLSGAALPTAPVRMHARASWLCRSSKGVGRSEPSSEPAGAAGHAGRAQGLDGPRATPTISGQMQWTAGAGMCSQRDGQALGAKVHKPWSCARRC